MAGKDFVARVFQVCLRAKTLLGSCPRSGASCLTQSQRRNFGGNVALRQKTSNFPPAPRRTTGFARGCTQPRRLFLACYPPRTWDNSSPPTSPRLAPPLPLPAAERTSFAPPSTPSTAGPRRPGTELWPPRLPPRARPCPLRRANPLPPPHARPRLSVEDARHRSWENRRRGGTCTSAGCPSAPEFWSTGSAAPSRPGPPGRWISRVRGSGTSQLRSCSWPRQRVTSVRFGIEVGAVSSQALLR